MTIEGLTIEAVETWASAHPYLWGVVLLSVVPAVTSAIAESVRRAGWADTLAGRVVLALCADVLAAARQRGQGTPPPPVAP